MAWSGSGVCHGRFCDVSWSVGSIYVQMDTSIKENKYILLDSPVLYGSEATCWWSVDAYEGENMHRPVKGLTIGLIVFLSAVMGVLLPSMTGAQSAAMVIDITQDRSIMYEGESSTITLVLTMGGDPLAGVNIYMSTDSEGSFEPVNGTTDESGEFTTVFSAPSVDDDTRTWVDADITYGNISDERTVYYNIKNFVPVNVNEPVSKTLDDHSITVNSGVVGQLDMTLKSTTIPLGAPDQGSLGTYFEIGNTGNGTLRWASIEVEYGDVPEGFDVEELRIYYWDNVGRVWVVAPNGGIDTEDKTVWANITKSAVYALMVPASAIAPQDVQVTVGPIYDLDGELVSDLDVILVYNDTEYESVTDENGMALITIDGDDWLGSQTIEGRVERDDETYFFYGTITSDGALDSTMPRVVPEVEDDDVPVLYSVGIPVVIIIIVLILLLAFAKGDKEEVAEDAKDDDLDDDLDDDAEEDIEEVLGKEPEGDLDQDTDDDLKDDLDVPEEGDEPFEDEKTPDDVDDMEEEPGSKKPKSKDKKSKGKKGRKGKSSKSKGKKPKSKKKDE